MLGRIVRFVKIKITIPENEPRMSFLEYFITLRSHLLIGWKRGARWSRTTRWLTIFTPVKGLEDEIGWFVISVKYQYSRYWTKLLIVKCKHMLSSV
jgi:hypothetical protein